MKRTVLAALAALAFLTADPPAWAAHYYYIPIIIPGPGAAALPDPDVGSYDKIHKVAILSSLGPTFLLKNNNASMPLDISGFRIDQEIADTIRQYLGRRFEFVDMNFDPAQINALPTQFMRESKTTDLVKTFANPGVDAYILVRPLAADRGLELAYQGYYDVDLLAHYEIDVVDAHTGRYISKSVGRVAELPGDAQHFPGVPMPPDFWLGYEQRLAPAKMELMHKYLTQLMKRSLVETVRSLEFGVPLPPTGDHSIAEPIMADMFSGIRSVAVVSAVGSQLQMINPGNMFAARTDSSVPIDGWGLDDRIEEILRKALSPHYTVKQVHANRQVLSRETLTGGARLPAIPGFDATDQVDVFVVVLAAIEHGGPYHGMGMVHVTPVINHEADIFANYAIVVIDARNLVPVTGFVAVRGEMTCARPERVSLGVPACRVEEKLWPDKDASFSPQATGDLRKAFDEMLAASIPETLFHLGLNQDQAGAQ